MPDPIKDFRTTALSGLTNAFGVYALCDLDEVPIYVGQSFGGAGAGIRSRVRRHLTSARSDVIANRLIDIWEVAYVWAWPCNDRTVTDQIEAHLFIEFDAKMPLMNGKALPVPRAVPAIPERGVVQVLPTDEIALRRERRLRFPRQLQQTTFLLDYLLEVKDVDHMRRSLRAHFERLTRYHNEFQATEAQAEEGTQEA